MCPKSTLVRPVRHPPIDHGITMGLQWEQLGNMTKAYERPGVKRLRAMNAGPRQVRAVIQTIIAPPLPPSRKKRQPQPPEQARLFG